MNTGDIVLIDNHKPAMIMNVTYLYGNQEPGHMVSFFGSKESAWYSNSRKMSTHIPREDRTMDEMKELLYLIKALS